MDIGVYGARGIPSTYSGYETFLTALLPELASRGNRVTIYCRSGRVSAEPIYRGVHKVFLPAPQSKQFETLAHGILAQWKARVAKHDILFVVNVANALYASFAKATRQPIVLNTDGQEWLRGKWGRVAKTYFLLSARMSKHAASALISDSRGMRRVYREQFGVDSTVIPYCWTEIDYEDKPEALASMGLADRGYLLIAGRLIPENNIERVAQAYTAADVQLPLLVLGAANYNSPVQRALRSLARDSSRIILGGHISDRASYATLVKRATAYIHTHSVGGINPSLVEAMGCGARILALSTEFNREALDDAGTYFADFEEELPRALKAIIEEDPAQNEILRRAASSRTRSTFDLPSIVQAHEQLFRAALRDPSRKSTVIPTRWSEALKQPLNGDVTRR